VDGGRAAIIGFSAMPDLGITPADEQPKPDETGGEHTAPPAAD